MDAPLNFLNELINRDALCAGALGHFNSIADGATVPTDVQNGRQ